jgi:glycosyltransferase involved in cell wall biosynthesis
MHGGRFMNAKFSFNKMCFYISSLQLGGAELQVIRLSKYFIKRGIDVVLLTDYSEGQYMARVPRGVKFYSLQGNKGIARIRAFKDFVAMEKPDFVAAASFSCAVTSLIANLLFGVDAKTFILVTGRISRRNPNFREKLFRLTPLVLRLLSRQAAGFIAVSEDAAEDAVATLSIPKDMIEVIYNPVDCAELGYLAENGEITHEWLTKKNFPLIVAAGRLDPIKDFPTLVKAFAKVRETRDARLIILGEGPERDRILKMTSSLGVAEWVDLPGYTDNPYVYMKKADVLALSSVAEGLPNVLIEAIALGTPVVSTDCGGPREILNRGTVGKLVPVGDSEAMAKAICELLDNPPSSSLLQAKARDFDLSVIGEKYLCCFNHFLRKERMATNGN